MRVLRPGTGRAGVVPTFGFGARSTMALFVTPPCWKEAFPFSEEDLRDWLSIPPPMSKQSCSGNRHGGVDGTGMRHKQTRAWLVHAIVDEEITIKNALRRHLCLPEDICSRLICFGAVHWSRIPPEVPDNALLPHAAAALHVREKAIEMLHSSGDLATMSQMERARLSKTERVLNECKVVPMYSYIRVHMWPKRFPVFYHVDWKQRVVAQGEEYIVMNKPSGLPVPPTVDNILENVIMGASVALGSQGNVNNMKGDSASMHGLLITSRIDQPTEGLVVIGRNPDFVRRFNESVTKRLMKKRYKAAVAVSPERILSIDTPSIPDGVLGDIKHRVRVKFRAPGLPFFTLVDDTEVSGNTTENTLDCHMIVNSAVYLNEDVTHCVRKQYGIANEDRVLELDIELVTGRTHQIRCQLSAMGLPIIGDTLYAQLSDKKLRNALLQGNVALPCDGKERLLCEPSGPIALQAYHLHFTSDHDIFDEHKGESVTFEIKTPWWHQSDSA